MEYSSTAEKDEKAELETYFADVNTNFPLWLRFGYVDCQRKYDAEPVEDRRPVQRHPAKSGSDRQASLEIGETLHVAISRVELDLKIRHNREYDDGY